MNPELIEQEPVTMSQVKAELKAIKKRDGELSFRANKVEDYLNTFHVPSKKDVEQLFKKISDLEIPRFKAHHIAKIVDLLPGTVDELKFVLSGYNMNLTKDAMDKIVKAVKDYLPEKD
ncbi:hypothetical protein CMO92_01840 [Candidatus Woesearchaeota archaeon]|nr:hypothetical protein [Candidatus Woesearchaeota archaeon]|tara:strand:+ start:130 stop:483 length:354 start_codon:yes stop_codon:yes gene_type:complete